MQKRFHSRLVAVLVVALALAVGAQSVAVARSGGLAGPLGATDGLPGVRYLHGSTNDNVTGMVTYLDHPLLNDNPGAIFFVTQNMNAGGWLAQVFNLHEIGVLYDGVQSRWAIFNQDGTDMPVGSDYNVLIPDAADGVFVHTATEGDTLSNWTYIDHPRTNNNPNALIFITQNWNPGGVGSTTNDHPVGVYYESRVQQWAIFNQDGAPMPVTASFNILVAGPDSEAFVHRATADSIFGLPTLVDYGLTNGDSHALLFVTQNWNPGGAGGVYNPYNIITSYHLLDKWAIQNTSSDAYAPMTEGAAFNVLVVHTPEPFVTYQATAENVTGAGIFIEHPLLNGRPNAVAFVTQNFNPGGIGGTYNDRAIGLWYGGSGQWGVFNQDESLIPEGAGFNLLVPNMDAGVFVHRQTAANTRDQSTFMEHPLTDSNSDAIIFVTQNWNPGGLGGMENNHPIGVWYDGSIRRWAVYNQDQVDMPPDAAFNVYVPLPGPNVFVHTTTSTNQTGNSTYIDHPLLNGKPNARLLVTHNYNPGGSSPGVHNAHNIGVWYNAAIAHWTVFNQDGAEIPIGASFNVMVGEPIKIFLPVVLRRF